VSEEDAKIIQYYKEQYGSLVGEWSKIQDTVANLNKAQLELSNADEQLRADRKELSEKAKILSEKAKVLAEREHNINAVILKELEKPLATQQAIQTSQNFRDRYERIMGEQYGFNQTEHSGR
jgi:uncharacterized protein (DUF3084 family)